MIANILDNTQMNAAKLDLAQVQMSSAKLEGSARSQFEDLMRISTDRVDLAGKSKQEQVENLTNQFVAIAFINPMLEKMRDSPFKSDLFGGGSAGDAFQQQFDTILSDRISQRANFPIARVMYERMMGGVKPIDRAESTTAPGNPNHETTESINTNG